MPNALSKLTRRLMGDRTVAATAAETEYVEASALRDKIGYLSMMDLFRDFSPEEMQEIDRAMRMQTCNAGRVFYTPGETGEVLRTWVASLRSKQAFMLVLVSQLSLMSVSTSSEARSIPLRACKGCRAGTMSWLAMRFWLKLTLKNGKTNRSRLRRASTRACAVCPSRFASTDSSRRRQMEWLCRGPINLWSQGC